MSEPQHHPSRPEWTCETCGQVWPCPPARDRLVAESGDQLPVVMAGYLNQLCADRPDTAAGVGFARMIAWTRRVPLDATC